MTLRISVLEEDLIQVQAIFTVPADGIYTFNVTYYADGAGGSREVSIHVNSATYEKIADEISTW